MKRGALNSVQIHNVKRTPDNMTAHFFYNSAYNSPILIFLIFILKLLENANFFILFIFLYSLRTLLKNVAEGNRPWAVRLVF